MEKFRFGNKLREAVLSYEDGRLYVTVGGEKRKVRSPVPLKMNSIGEKGIACLISERAGNEVEIVAVLFDDLRKEGKDWICVNPRLTEQAVGFFLDRHLMERMTNDYKTVIRGTFADFVIDEKCKTLKGFLKSKNVDLDKLREVRKKMIAERREELRKIWESQGYTEALARIDDDFIEPRVKGFIH